MSQDARPVPVAFSVTSERIQYYGDVIEHMTRDAIARFKRNHGKEPSRSAVVSYTKELVRYAVIRRDLDVAARLEIKEKQLLNE